MEGVSVKLEKKKKKCKVHCGTCVDPKDIIGRKRKLTILLNSVYMPLVCSGVISTVTTDDKDSVWLSLKKTTYVQQYNVKEIGRMGKFSSNWVNVHQFGDFGKF